MAKGVLEEEGMPGRKEKWSVRQWERGMGNEACITKNRLRGVFQQLPTGANGLGLQGRLKEFLSLLLV